jgi:hypothetical protein
MTRRNTSSKANGHAGSHGRPNGHAPDSTERGGVPSPRDQAASDDDSRASAARAAGSATAPGTDCESFAEAGPPHPHGTPPETTGNTSDPANEEELIPGGEFPLPANAGEFVEEIHRRADLFVVWQKLLNSKDDKIRQRAVERLTDLRYKLAAEQNEEPQRIVVDMPRPDRD